MPCPLLETCTTEVRENKFRDFCMTDYRACWKYQEATETELKPRLWKTRLTSEELDKYYAGVKVEK